MVRSEASWSDARTVLPGQISRTTGESRLRRTRLRRRIAVEALIGRMMVDGLMGFN